MQRRALLKLLMLAPLAVNATAAWARAQPHWDRRLILIELKGGNDGLNTVIPYADPQYYKLRPTLAIKRDAVVQLTEATGLHPALETLLSVWERKELAIVQGLGYANPNLSHFRSGDIWHTGSDSEIIFDEGWLARLFKVQPPPASYTADGIVIGSDIGPLVGESIRMLAMKDPQRFIKQAQRVSSIKRTTSNEAFKHILQIQQGIHDSARKLETRLGVDAVSQKQFPKTAIGRQLAMVAQLIQRNVDTPVIKISHGSFDTHTNQLAQHNNLLRQLAEALVAFRKTMKAGGHWNDVLVMTYSEFGRRPAENGSRGTDHGTAAPHFVLGGQVKGGLYGQQPSLTRLENQNLRHTLDYRHLYATAARWWGLNLSMSPFAAYSALDIV